MKFRRDFRDKLIQRLLNCALWKPRIPQNCFQGSTSIWVNLFLVMFKTKNMHAIQMCYRSKLDAVVVTNCDLFSCLIRKCYTFQLINKSGIPLLAVLCIGEPCERLYFKKGFPWIKVKFEKHRSIHPPSFKPLRTVSGIIIDVQQILAIIISYRWKDWGLCWPSDLYSTSWYLAKLHLVSWLLDHFSFHSIAVTSTSYPWESS